MRQLLVINPNMSAHVSALLQRHVQGAAGSHVAVRTATARFGAPYIVCEASYAVAAHAALDVWAHEITQPHAPPDAVLIGCFGDPGLMALRESSPVPRHRPRRSVIFVEAARHGRFAIVTGGERWGPMLQRLAQALGTPTLLAGIHTVAPTGAQLAADPEAARALLAQACRDVVRQMGVQAVILGGAGLAGMAAAVQPQVSVPVIDSVVAGATWALRAHPVPPERKVVGFDVAWVGVSQEMATLGLAGVV